MIDISTEEVLTFSEACKRIPSRRRGKAPNIATLYRWTNQGIRGVRLEYVMVGGTRCTSVEALQRFFDRLTERAEERLLEPPVKPRSATRCKQIEAAERRLKVAGI